MLHEDVDRRLQNWGRWKHGAGAGGLGYAKVQMGAPMVDCDRYPESTVPTSNVEAEETDRAVMTLASELRATVEVYYVMGGGMADKAKRLAVQESTIYSRLHKARQKINNWLSDKLVAREAERKRVEALMKIAR